MENTATLLRVNKITKSFPGVTALKEVDFSLRRGEIHALMGENGAGKSTLIKVLTGVEHPDTGSIELDEKPVLVHSPQHSQELGISTVFQEVNLCTNLSVAENIMLGREPHRLGSIDWTTMNRMAQKAIKRLNLDIDVSLPLGNYSLAIQQMVSIARSLEITSAKILILDEPTSSLDVNEVNLLFDVMRKLKQEGIGIIFITHFINQAYQVADRITVLRNGQLVGTYEASTLPVIQLIAKMLGRNIADMDAVSRAKGVLSQKVNKETLLEAKGLGHKGSLEPMDLDLHIAEVVGIAGLLGSGRTEIANLLFGIDIPENGSVRLQGEKIEHFSPLDSIKNGIALCPEDRKDQGIFGDLTIRENIILALQARGGWWQFLSAQQQTDITQKFIKLLGIITPSTEQLARNLSGGNQQKLILARWLAINPKVLILDEPTRGIDVGAKAEIQKLVLDFATEGKSCIFISSELEEVMRISHRIIVMRDHKKAGEYPGDVSDHVILQTMEGSL